MKYSKSSLAITLSKLNVFAHPKPRLEQYPTDSEIAADILWQAYMKGDIKGKTIADIGCGTGVLGIAALLLGAKQVTFIDKDNTALEVLRTNLKDLNIDEGFNILNLDVTEFNGKADIVLQNPPFGTRDEHIDRTFLKTAMLTAKIIYSFHKTTTTRFVESFSADNEFSITEQWTVRFPLKQTLSFHKKKIQRIEVTCFRLKKT